MTAGSCAICAAPLTEAFRAEVLHRHEAIYDHCCACGFLCVRKPHWLAEAYSEAIALTDTGLMWRNQAIARRLTALFTVMGVKPDDRFLDYAGGYGALTRLMRDAGFDFHWSDPYCRNLLATGFEYAADLGPCRAVTAFEVLEHVENPREFVTAALAAGATDTLIFTTELYAGSPPHAADWWYYSVETGQHIAFYRRDTLACLAEKLGLHFHSSHGLHMYSQAPLPTRRIDLALGRLQPLVALLGRLGRKSKVTLDHDLMVERLAANAAGRPDAHRL